MVNLEKENVIWEIRELVENIDSAKSNGSIYCDLLKQIFLSASGQN